jgi:FG-GAP-like repeat/FG-GAP repeat
MNRRGRGSACALAALDLMLFLATPASVRNAPDSDPELARALSALQRGDYSGAVRALEPGMPARAANAHAWRALGFAHLKLKEPQAALDALRKARALYDMGLAELQRGDAEQAFAWLQKAKATRRFDMTQLDVEEGVQSLRGDPRYAALLPRPEDFAHPFVEDVRVLHEWDGEAAGDQFGWIARVIGDVDHDGVNDFVTSAPTKNIHGENAGRVYVYSGRTGALLWSADGAPGDQLGSGIECAGDVDGDGVPDVIASAPYIDTAYVYSGRDGRVLLTLHGATKGDNFGQHVASAGDVDADGHADIIIGAPNAAAAGKDAGGAYVYSGKDGHLLLALAGERPGDMFGSTVTGYADGKYRFLVVGAPSAGPRKAGRVYVYSGLARRPKFVIDADATGVALGYMFVSVLGDVDGDGVPDIFASDWSNAAKGPGTGRVYVYSGRTGQRLYTFTGATPGEGFGTTHSVAGDVNGDGRADLIVGSWQYSGAAQSGGRAYLYDGRTGGLLHIYTGRIPGDTFGFDAVGMGTTDDSGQAELLITAAWSAVRGFHTGRIFLISSGIKGSARSLAHQAE